jgi:uncharacterized LabA/DUF88 family protein
MQIRNFSNNKKQKVAYIDASNLKFGIKQSDWEMDYKSFRSWLRDKFQVEKAILFLGLIPEQAELYNFLQKIGFEIIFKTTLKDKNGNTKGNVDGELILEIVKDFYEEKTEEFILISGDGDYACVVEFLKEKNKSIQIISPNQKYLSYLLKRTNVEIVILEDFKEKLKIKKPPNMP